MKSRIQKLLAEADVASRRAAEQLIEQGRVRVNGTIATLGDKADPNTDVIEVDGDRLNFAEHQKKVYFALYKPKNVLATSVVHRGDERRTVLDLVPYKGHLFTIGRLDAESEGLIVLTNDGDLTHKLTHPRYRHTKTYKVTVRGMPSENVLSRWEEGIWLEDEGKTAPCVVNIIKGAPRESILRITMTEGKKRQIRRVALALGHPVERLVRTHIGMLSIEGLRPGEWRELDLRDVQSLSTPSPALKEISAKKRARREAGNNKAQAELRSAETRPRQRSLIDEDPSDERPRRRESRVNEYEPRAERRPKRRSDASARSDFSRRRRYDDDTRTDERTGGTRFRPSEGVKNRKADTDRVRSGASSYRDRAKQYSSDEASRGEGSDRPRNRRDNQASRSGDRPQRRSSRDGHTSDHERSSSSGNDSRRPKSSRSDSPAHGQRGDRSQSQPHRGTRNRAGDDRSTRKSSDNRRRTTHNNPRRRQGRDEQ